MTFNLSSLSGELRGAISGAAVEVLECHRVLGKAGLNVIGEVLKGQGDFVEFDHYPSDDVFDNESHSQYYYHVAISMDDWGMPIGLFCTNRWVTAEAWYSAEQVIAMLDNFSIDHAAPNWAVNRWITAMVRLCRPQIEFLLRQRDQVAADWQKSHPGEDVFEDRALEITGHLAISVPDMIEQLQKLESK